MFKNHCQQCKKHNKGECYAIYSSTSVFKSRSCENYEASINLKIVGKTNNTQTETSLKPNLTPIQPISPLQTCQKRFSHPFSLKGRLSCLEYGLIFITSLLYELLMELIPESTSGESWMIFCIIWLLLLIPFMVFVIAQNTKYCHNLGHLGLWSWIYGLWLLFSERESEIMNT